MKTKFTIKKAGINRMTKFILLILFLIPIGTFGQKSHENEWWYPIIQKHKVELQTYNSYEKIFEMGTTSTIDNKIVTLENAFFIILESDDKYSIITFSLAYHDLDKSIIEGNNCTWKSFSIKSKNIEPTEQFKCKKLKYDLISKKAKITDIEESAIVIK